MWQSVKLLFNIHIFGFTRLVRVTQYDFLQQSDAIFSKELAIAKPAKYMK